MAGRLRTASRPSKTVIELAEYESFFFFVVKVAVVKAVSSSCVLLIPIPASGKQTGDEI